MTSQDLNGSEILVLPKVPPSHSFTLSAHYANKVILVFLVLE